MHSPLPPIAPPINERRNTPRDRSRLQWVVLLAAVASLLLHVLLIFAFRGIHFILPEYRQVLSFRIPRAEIDPATLKPPAAAVAAGAESLVIPDLTEVKKFDLTEIQGRIPEDREVKITPEVKKPENIQDGVSMDGGQALESIQPLAMEEQLPSLASSGPRIPELATEVSPNQPLLAAGNEGNDTGKARETLEKAINGNQGLANKFSTLDELLGVPGGKLTDIRKPIYMPSDLLFDFREARLREEAKTSLMMLGILIDRNPDTTFIIEGHTDTIGSDANNLDLSRRRAQAVGDWLQQSLRIPPTRIRIEGLGESRPLVAPDGGIEQQQPNRRVEIRMVREQAGTTTSTQSPPSIIAPVDRAPTVRAARPVQPPGEPEVRTARPVTP